MAPLQCIELDADQRAQLLAVARASILNGLEHGRKLPTRVDDFDPRLQAPSAVFITLTHAGELRGCIGSLQASLPLVQAVADAAHNAAFSDRRFGPLQADELGLIQIEISVLSQMQPIEVADRAALLRELEPGVDGLLIEDGGHRATFLPKVWEKIDSASGFLEQLMLKAGLAPDYWSGTIRCYRYRTLSFAEN